MLGGCTAAAAGLYSKMRVWGVGKGRECLAGQGGRACFVSFREGQRLQGARRGTASNSTGGTRLCFLQRAVSLVGDGVASRRQAAIRRVG